MDTHPKEHFVFHAAGLGGRGSASYIDSVAFRDKDTTAWTANGRTPLDQRHYSLLNWRSDVVVIVTDTGTLVQHARYNDSGSPWGIPAGDVNGDGIVNTVDTGIVLGAIGGAYVARYDLNLDGTIDAADHTIANNHLGDTLGHNALSLNPSSDARGGHRLGYTGHTHADFNNALIVMRHRWYSGDLGRFMSRDPMGFVDGGNVYAYARGNGLSGRDPMGLRCSGAMCAVAIPPVPPNSLPHPPQHLHPDICTTVCSLHHTPVARSVCYKGKPYFCDCTLELGLLLPQDLMDALRDCIGQCEPLHGPNMDCLFSNPAHDVPGIPGLTDPEHTPFRGGGCGKCCSEANVIGCAAQCLISKCVNIQGESNQELCRAQADTWNEFASKTLEACIACSFGRPIDELHCRVLQ